LCTAPPYEEKLLYSFLRDYVYQQDPSARLKIDMALELRDHWRLFNTPLSTSTI
jgi:hypothetical protein